MGHWFRPIVLLCLPRPSPQVSLCHHHYYQHHVGKCQPQFIKRQKCESGLHQTSEFSFKGRQMRPNSESRFSALFCSACQSEMDFQIKVCHLAGGCQSKKRKCNCLIRRGRVVVCKMQLAKVTFYLHSVWKKTSKVVIKMTSNLGPEPWFPIEENGGIKFQTERL